MELPTPHFRYHVAEGGLGVSRRPWRTGFWKRAPVSGLLALVTALLCGVVAIVVLKASDGLPLEDWQIRGYNVQPTVLLSVLATVANALFRYAFSESARISWWTQAQKGTTIGALHRSWDHAQSAIPLLTSGKHVSITAVVSFFMVLLLIDGPLLQRASSVSVITKHTTKNLTIPVSPDPFITGATGLYADNDYYSDPTLYTPLFSNVLQQYNTRKPIVLPHFGCKGKCDLQLIAPGFEIDCHTWNSPYHFLTAAEVVNETDAAGGSNDTYEVPQTMFWSNVTYAVTAEDLWRTLRRYRIENDSTIEAWNWPWASRWNTIMLSSMVKSTPSHTGTLTWRYCLLHEAVQRYPVTITNTTVAIQPMSLHQNFTVYQVLREDEGSGMGVYASTLGGLWLSASHDFSGKAQLQNDGPWTTVRTNDSSPLIYVDYPNKATSDYYTFGITWTDPIDDAISMIQELSLRTAIATTFHQDVVSGKLTATQPDILSPNLTLVNRTLSQTVNASMESPETVYQAHLD